MVIKKNLESNLKNMWVFSYISQIWRIACEYFKHLIWQLIG